MSAVADRRRVEVRVQITPPWPFRLGRRGGMDGLLKVKQGVVHRLIHISTDVPVYLRTAQLSSGDVVIGAMCNSREAAQDAIVRMRRAIGVDLDLKAFYEEFKADPLIGAAVKANPTLRPAGRPVAFEALSWAVTEQLIEYDRAVAIQRRMIHELGRRDEVTGLKDSPSAITLAGTAPARLEAMDLVGKRALALTRVAREVAAGRIDLDCSGRAEQEIGWARLRQIPNVGAWTTEILALIGQQRLDQIPAGDLGFIKLVGRLQSGGDPKSYATEQQVRELFERFGQWKGLAGVYALRSGNMIKTPIT